MTLKNIYIHALPMINPVMIMYITLNTQGLQLLLQMDYTYFTRLNQLTGGRVFSWKNDARLIPSTVYIPLLSIQMYSEIPEPSYFETLAVQGRHLSHTCRPRRRCLNLGSSMHMFEMDSTWNIPAWGLFISGYFKACDWPPFCELQGDQIWQLLIPKGERIVVRLVEWMLTIGAQDDVRSWQQWCTHDYEHVCSWQWTC
jgi:hypothetical protein